MIRRSKGGEEFLRHYACVHAGGMVAPTSTYPTLIAFTIASSMASGSLHDPLPTTRPMKIPVVKEGDILRLLERTVTGTGLTSNLT